MTRSLGAGEGNPTDMNHFRKLGLAFLACSLFALGACSLDDVARIANNVAAAAPKTCIALQVITGDITTYAGQVSAANVNDTKLAAIITKINSHAALANADCAVLAAAAPTVAAAVSSGAITVNVLTGK